MIGWKVALAATAALASAGLALVGEPGPTELVAFKRVELDAKLADRSVHLDPAEVLSLMRNKQVRLHLLDVRDEVDFNRFHLTDSKRVRAERLRSGELQKTLHPLALKIVISNDEARAEKAWRLLEATGVRGAYVLAGGANLWVEVFRDGKIDAQPLPTAGRDDTLRHGFDFALGGRHPFSRPTIDAAEGRSYEEKAELLTKVKKLAGGCGG